MDFWLNFFGRWKRDFFVKLSLHIIKVNQGGLSKYSCDWGWTLAIYFKLLQIYFAKVHICWMQKWCALVSIYEPLNSVQFWINKPMYAFHKRLVGDLSSVVHNLFYPKRFASMIYQCINTFVERGLMSSEIALHNLWATPKGDS
jgi:hypothetical protein